MIVLAHLERWLSGRKRQIANLLYVLGRTEGSNPSLSVSATDLASEALHLGRSPLACFGCSNIDDAGPKAVEFAF